MKNFWKRLTRKAQIEKVDLEARVKVAGAQSHQNMKTDAQMKKKKGLKLKWNQKFKHQVMIMIIIDTKKIIPNHIGKA